MPEPELLEGARTLGIELICSGANPRRHFDPEELTRIVKASDRDTLVALAEWIRKEAARAD